MGGYRNKGFDNMNITDVTLEPYTTETGDQRESIKVTFFYIKIQFGGVWYKSEKYYRIADALDIRDTIKRENVIDKNSFR